MIEKQAMDVDQQKTDQLTASVPLEAGGKRVDAIAAQLFDEYSRSRLQHWIAEGYLTVDGRSRRCKDKLAGGELLQLTLPEDLQAGGYDESWKDGDLSSMAEDVPVTLVYEDDALFIVDKPAGLVMHPAPGNRNGTLFNGLLHLDPALAGVPRAGIVHRLDKETSGLCVVARTLIAHTHLVRQLQARTMGREYLAVVQGDVPLNGAVDAPIGRHNKDRKRMAVSSGGKPAVTHYQMQERFPQGQPHASLVNVKLETGRTHQIRVHMTHIGHPLLGDPVYGRRRAVLPRVLADDDTIGGFPRQALHATRLSLNHPDSEEWLSFTAEPPEDFAGLCDALRRLKS